MKILLNQMENLIIVCNVMKILLVPYLNMNQEEQEEIQELNLKLIDQMIRSIKCNIVIIDKHTLLNHYAVHPPSIV